MDVNKKEALALQSLSFLRKDLSKKYRYMMLAFYNLKDMADQKEESLSTDGEFLFFNTDYVLKSMKGKASYRELSYQFLHIVMHCLLGHVYRYSDEMDEQMYHQCADLIAYEAVKKMNSNYKSIPKKISISKEYHQMTQVVRGHSVISAVKSCSQKERYREALYYLGDTFYCDDHRYWNRPNPIVAQSSMGGTAQSGAGNPDHWNSVRGFIENEVYKSGREGRKLWGLFSSGETETVQIGQDNVSDYKKILERLTVMKEVQQVDFDEIDYMWYEIGMSNYGNIPFIEPAECVEKKVQDNIIIAIDTSGSCAGEIASRFLRETCNMIRDMDIHSHNFDIRIIQCDAAIQKEWVIHSEDDIPDFGEMEMSGWGGTDFRPVFKHIDTLIDAGEMEHVAALIYFSDGYGSFPEEPNEDYETIFVLTEYNLSNWNIPEWITKIVLTEEDICELGN